MILKPLSLGTISPPAVVSSDVAALLSDEHDERSEGATRADAPPMAIVFRKSLRSAIVVYVSSYNFPTNKDSKYFIILKAGVRDQW